MGSRPIDLSKNGIVMPRLPQIPTAASILTNKNPAQELYRVNKILSGEPLNIGVVRSGGGVGDVLMTFPTVKALKHKYNCKLTYITDFEYLNGALRKIAEHNSYIDEIIDWRHFKEANYDIVINLTCPCVAHEVPKAPPVHRIDLFARSCGLYPLADRQLDYTPTTQEIGWGKDFLANRNLNPNHTIMVQPYASNARRSYDIKQLQRALIMVTNSNDNIRFLIIRHSSDFDAGDIQWDFRHMLSIKDYDITALAGILYNLPMIVAPDSAMLHMGAALYKKIVGYFGPTDYRARMYPNMRAVCPAEILPCWPTWYHSTQIQDMECWRLLTPEMLASAILEEYNSMNLSQSKLLGSNIKVESL